MLGGTILIVTAIYLSSKTSHFTNGQYDEAKGKQFLQYLNDIYLKQTHKTTLTEWDYESNINNNTLAKKLESNADAAKLYKQLWAETIKYPWRTYKDPDVKRQFMKFAVLGESALPEDKYSKLDRIISEMSSIYSTAKICAYDDPKKCDLSLEPEITEIMAKSRNEPELKHVWVEWSKNSGAKVKQLYEDYIKLENEAASLNNFTDASEFWLRNYESQSFREDISKIWEQVKPLYLQLHAYVRRKLRETYGDSVVSKKGPIPAHLFGNMWAQTWTNLIDITAPFPNARSQDVTSYLVKQNYTPVKMFKLAEEFFTSVNLSAMPALFWERSILSKLPDREMVCHASAWDFYDSADFRIKQCTDITEEDLTTAHHEMGHIQYYLQYKDQPFAYREGANPGFHEAIGDVIALSVATPEHMSRIGLLPELKSSKEADLNALFKMALSKISFLPFGYLMDLWRWNVFKGQTTPDYYNCQWWKLRTNYQGISPPVERTETDFDPGSKYHIVASVPYIRYFVSFVIQFQFHEALCKQAGKYDPKKPDSELHKCDIYKSTEAGNLLGRMLKMGSSKPWPDAMEELTGQRNMDARPLMQYFKPIYDWLKTENEKSGEYIGWESKKLDCEPIENVSSVMRKFVGNMQNILDEDSSYV